MLGGKYLGWHVQILRSRHAIHEGTRGIESYSLRQGTAMQPPRSKLFIEDCMQSCPLLCGFLQYTGTLVLLTKRPPWTTHPHYLILAMLLQR